MIGGDAPDGIGGKNIYIKKYCLAHLNCLILCLCRHTGNALHGKFSTACNSILT